MSTAKTAGDTKSRRRRIRDRFRHASLLHRYLAKESRATVVPVVSIQNLDRLARQRRLAVSKGWHAATARIDGRMLNVLASIRVQSEDAIAALNSSAPPIRMSVMNGSARAMGKLRSGGHSLMAAGTTSSSSSGRSCRPTTRTALTSRWKTGMASSAGTAATR